MSSTDNTPTETDQIAEAEVTVVSTVPAYEELLQLPLDDLLDCRRVFESADDALAWHEANGEKVATNGFDPILHLLEADNADLREEGVMRLGRAIKAQVIWGQCFKIFELTSSLSILKRSVASVRDHEAGEEDHLKAIKKFRTELRIASDKLAEREVILDYIERHAQDEMFVEWLQEGNHLKDTREGVTKRFWATNAFKSFLEGSTNEVSTKTFEGLLKRLNTLNRTYVIERINEHLSERKFMEWVRSENRLYDERDGCRGDREWRKKALSAIEEGRHKEVRTSELKGLLYRLNSLSERYFGGGRRTDYVATGDRNRRERHRFVRNQNRSKHEEE